MNNNYNIFWGIIFIYFLGLFLCVMIPSEANAVTEVSTTTNSESDVKSKGRTVVISPPPSAISPSIGGSSSDICTSGVSGAIQTQILGVSTGETVRDENCERLKISKTLYDTGKGLHSNVSLFSNPSMEIYDFLEAENNVGISFNENENNDRK